MKKLIVIVLVLFFVLTACTNIPNGEGGTPSIPAQATAPGGGGIASPTTASLQPTIEPTSAPPASTDTSPDVEMYSSYAHLVSFDPSTGIAKFDYFDMLRGQEAKDFLVKYKGYTKEKAQELVDNFSDSEFVEKNINSQLRSIDIDGINFLLMFQPSGAEVTGDAVPSSFEDFYAIYQLNPSLLLNRYFYYIHVKDNGTVELVEQVWWP